MDKGNKAAVTVLSHQAGDHLKATAIKSIIVDALFYEQTPRSREYLFTQIEAQFGVLIHSEQFSASIDSLIEEAIVVEEKGKQLSLSDVTRADMQLKRLEEQSFRNRAILEWAEQNAVPLDEHSTEIFELVDKFVRSVFIRHGATSYSLIAGKQPIEQFAIDSIEKETLERCDAGLVELVDGKLKRILSYPFSENTIHYLRNNAKQATSYLSGIMPTEYVKSLESRLSNLILYIDTNVVYRLLGLQGNERFVAVEKAIQFCCEHGVDVRVSAETYKELSKTIAYDAKTIINFPTKSSLAATGYRLRSTDNYISEFWAETARTGVSAQDFNQKYKNASLLLESKGIRVEPVSIDTDSLVYEAKRIYEKLSRIDGKLDSSDDVIWHDAYNMAYVKAQQKISVYTAIDTGCLFMTTDQSLTFLQRTDDELKNSPALCISPSQMLQVFSFSQPKDEYYDTFIQLFSSVAICYYKSDYENREIADIIGRLSQYQTIDDEIAIKILENQLLDSNYKNAQSNEEKEEIVYEQLTHELESAVSEARGQSESLLEENKGLYEERQSLNAKLDDIARDFSDRESKLIEQLDDARRNIATVNDELQKQKIETQVERKMKWWFVRRVLSLLAGMLLFGLATYCFFSTTIPEQISGYIKYVMGIFGLALLGYGVTIFVRSLQDKARAENKETLTEKKDFH